MLDNLFGKCGSIGKTLPEAAFFQTQIFLPMVAEASFLNSPNPSADTMDFVAQTSLTAGIYLGIFVVAGWLFFMLCVRCECSKTGKAKPISVRLN